MNSLGHNETPPRTPCAARIRYAAAFLRYADAFPRYAAAFRRYADSPPRYAAASLRYAEGSLRYAAVLPRYADGSPRYAAVLLRYAEPSLRYAAAAFWREKEGFGPAAACFRRHGEDLKRADAHWLKCPPRRTDGNSIMLKPAPAMPNAERQRQFRERNPGYYGRLHRRRRAAEDAGSMTAVTVEPPVTVEQPLAVEPPVVIAIQAARVGVNTVPADALPPTPIARDAAILLQLLYALRRQFLSNSPPR